MMIGVVNVEQWKFSEDLLLEEEMSRCEIEGRQREEEEEEEEEENMCACQTTGERSHIIDMK
jgi:hypothetical protein